MTQGDYRRVFHQILKARRNIGGLINTINVGRLHYVVAAIALACAEDYDPKPPLVDAY